MRTGRGSCACKRRTPVTLLLPETIMLNLRVVCFMSAFVVVGAHAETCSGGADGGMDATGNQCTSPGSALDSAQATLVLARIAATTSRPPVDRFARRADPSSEAAPGAPTEASGDATCSGGSDGGMDATGNQCSQVGFAGRVAGIRVSRIDPVAQREPANTQATPKPPAR